MRVCASSVAGWPMVLAWTPRGLPRKRRMQVEIVDRVHGDLDARHADEERKQVPGRVDVGVHFHIDKPAEGATLEQVVDRQHHRREAQLEVDGGLQVLAPTGGQDRRRLGEIAAHRLLDQHRGAVRQAIEDAEVHRRGAGRGRRGRRAWRWPPRCVSKARVFQFGGEGARLAASMSKMPATGSPAMR